MKENRYHLKAIEEYFSSLDEIPLFKAKNFPFESFSNSLKERFQLQDFSITITDSSWQTQTEIKSSLGENISQLCLVFTPLLGNVYFLIAQDEINSLTSACLTENSEENLSLTSNALQNGFYRYLVLNVLNSLEKTPTFLDLNAKIVEDADIKAQEAFVLSLNIKINDKKINAKIAITADFRKSWNNFYDHLPSPYTKQMQQETSLPLQIIAGHTILNYDDITTLKEGDFVILDKAHLNLKEKVFQVALSLDNNPLFLASIKKNKIHIMEKVSYYEENTPMEEKDFLNEDKSFLDEEITEDEIEITEENSIEEVNVQEEETVDLKKTPIKLTVEMAKISMPLEKLLNLQPGNYLELPLSIDAPVNLTVNGKKIGTAELTSIGDVFGIRVLKIG